MSAASQPDHSVNRAVAAMNEFFNALLDISKLDAGVLTPISLKSRSQSC